MVCPQISKINNLIKLCCLSFMVGHVWAAEVGLTHLRAAVVKDGHIKQRIISAVLESFHQDEIDEKQVVRLERNGKTAFLVPTTNFEEKSAGCYLTTLDGSAAVIDRVLLHKAADALTCETILTVFVCNLPSEGVGVIYGHRLGADNYYTEAGFFELSPDSRLTKNKALSRKIGDADTARKAKRLLGCK